MARGYTMLLTVLFLSSCGVFQYRQLYSPQNTINWKNLGTRSYKFVCDNGEVEVRPLVLNTKSHGQKKSWVYIKFKSKKRIEHCDLSYVHLENKISGQQVMPIDARTNVFNDDYLESKTTDCYYYFDVGREKRSIYNLYISDEVFGCTIAPISYAYEETTEWEPIQFQ